MDKETARKYVNRVEIGLGKEISFEEFIKEGIKANGYNETEQMFEEIKETWDLAGKDISNAQQLHDKYFGSPFNGLLDGDFLEPPIIEKNKIEDKHVVWYYKPILRWVVLLPIAIIGSIAMQIIWDGIIGIKLTGNNLFKVIVGNIIQGFTYIYIGITIAPKFKKEVSIVLIIFLFLIMIIFPLLIWLLKTPFINGTRWYYGVSSLIGTIIAHYQLAEK